MTLPGRMIGIMGVIDVLLVTYSIVVVMVYLTVGGRPGASAYAGSFERYALLLYLLPFVWTTLTAWSVLRPKPRQRAAAAAVWSWSLITLLLLVGDIVLSVQAAHIHAAAWRL